MAPHLPAAIYFAALVVAAELLRRRVRLAPDVTRKLFLAGVAVWAFPTLSLYESGPDAALPYLVLAALLYLSFRYELLVSIEDDGPSLGSVLFPASCAMLFLVFWGDRVAVAVAAIQAAGFGDGVAAVVGRRLGTRRYRSIGRARSMEGTLAMFLVSGAAMAFVLAVVGGLDSHQAVAFGLITATVAASVEALSVLGTDNLTVPIAAAATLATLLSFSQ